MTANQAKALVLFLVSCASMLIAANLYHEQADFKTKAGFWTAVVVAIGTFLVVPIELYFTDERKKAAEARNAEFAKDLENLRKEIEDEMVNFGRIRDKVSTEGNEPWRRAVEEQSFESITDAIQPLKSVRSYKKLIRQLEAEIVRNESLGKREKDVTQFMPLIDSLMKKIENDQRYYPPPVKTKSK